MSKAAIYVRVSENAANPRVEIDRQFNVAATYLISSGYEVLDRNLYHDIASSKTKAQRSGLTTMLEAADEGQFDTLYIYRLAQLSRKTSELYQIIEALKEKGVRVVCLQDSFDTALPNNQMTLAVLGAFMELERDHMRQYAKRSHK